MEKLKRIILEKKITEIFLAKDFSRCTAWMEHNYFPETMFINLRGILARSRGYWENFVDVVLTHETIHAVVYRLEGRFATKAIDNLWKNTMKSMFFVDCDPNWFKWKDFKK